LVGLESRRAKRAPFDGRARSNSLAFGQFLPTIVHAAGHVSNSRVFRRQDEPILALREAGVQIRVRPHDSLAHSPDALLAASFAGVGHLSHRSRQKKLGGVAR
jgi:hypothetical protein